MKLSRSLTILFLSLVYLLSIKILAVTTVDCLNCETTATPGVTPGTANAAQLAALVTEISARDRRMGCSFIKTDNDFDTVTSRLSVTPEEFFGSARCDNDWSREYQDVPEITPIQLSLLNPPGRMGIIMGLLEHLDRNVDDPSIVTAILNQRDDKGRTMLDFLEEVRTELYQGNDSALNALNTLRNEMCARGGVHTQRQDNCTARGRYARIRS